ncbi:MAG: sugar ABC transporter ATP-binding protein [Pyramidobacter sp.]|nr:sugar ABC transporter ATP-binding protein [Pyramidobacter sp.]
MSVLRTSALTKDFPGVRALDRFDFELNEGEIHGLVGENGAGKSTLVKLLTGVYQPTSGEIALDGSPVVFRSPRDAARFIGAVHQERELIGHFDGAANLFLGQEKTRGPFIDRAAMREEAEKLLSAWNVRVPLDIPVCDLGSGQQEMIMIMKVLLRSPRAVIFDEPTAALSAGECEILFALIRELKKRGVAVLYISHNLPEVLGLCDRITVMRNGAKVGTVPHGVSESELIRLMVSHDLGDQYPKQDVTIGEVLFEAKHFACPAENVLDASFNIRHGEIVGFAGLVGAGRTELARSVFCGLRHSGEMLLRGQAFASRSPADSIRSGVVMIPEDRRAEGIIPDHSVARNIQLPGLRGGLARFGFLDFARGRSAAQSVVERYGIKAADLAQAAETLSGGNQQKVAVGKWDGFDADLWIFDEPTQGIDVDAKREIYGIMGRIAASGAGVWFISSEMRELLALSDRIYVMNGRRITAEFARPFDGEAVLSAMMKIDQGGDRS